MISLRAPDGAIERRNADYPRLILQHTSNRIGAEAHHLRNFSGTIVAFCAR